MQQKVNLVTVAGTNEPIEYNDVTILKGQEGIYVETIKVIGKDDEDNDIVQNQLIMYPWEKIISLTWTENTLIESIKQGVILEALQDLEDFLEDYDEEEEDGEDEVPVQTDTKARDDPGVNPYK
jgi:hypothetical protein